MMKKCNVTVLGSDLMGFDDIMSLLYGELHDKKHISYFSADAKDGVKFQYYEELEER